jgi:hypothetical protein
MCIMLGGLGDRPLAVSLVKLTRVERGNKLGCAFTNAVGTNFANCSKFEFLFFALGFGN